MPLNPTSILFGIESKASIAEIKLDASIREEHVDSVQVTDHPIESGAVVSDHVFLMPQQLTMDGIITESPVKILAGIRGASAGFTALQSNLSGITTEGSVSPTISAHKSLTKLLQDRLPITVVTGLRSYKNMIMTQLRVPRSAETGRALRFSATFREIKIVSTQTVKIPESVLDDADKSKAQGKQTTGRQGAETPSADTTAKSQSLFSRLIQTLAEATI